MGSGFCAFCQTWHSAGCCHPGRAALTASENDLVALRAEVDRLRKALEEIARMCASGYYGETGHDYPTEAKRIARAALEAKP